MTRWICLLSILLTFGLFSTAQASVIGRNAPNSALLSSSINGFYAGATSNDYVFGPLGMSSLGHADPTSPAAPVSGPAIVDGGAPIAPASGTGAIAARMETLFQFGAPLGARSYDTFNFISQLTASATSAQNSAGEQADAVVGAVGRLEFFLDAFFASTAPDTVVGSIVLGPIRTLALYESAKVDIIQDGTTIIDSLLPGTAGLSVALLSGHSYAIELSHGLHVPFGVDPTVSLNIAGSLRARAIPEPSLPILLAIAGILLFAMKREQTKH